MVGGDHTVSRVQFFERPFHSSEFEYSKVVELFINGGLVRWRHPTVASKLSKICMHGGVTVGRAIEKG